MTDKYKMKKFPQIFKEADGFAREHRNKLATFTEDCEAFNKKEIWHWRYFYGRCVNVADRDGLGLEKYIFDTLDEIGGEIVEINLQHKDDNPKMEITDYSPKGKKSDRQVVKESKITQPARSGEATDAFLLQSMAKDLQEIKQMLNKLVGEHNGDVVNFGGKVRKDELKTLMKQGVE